MSNTKYFKNPDRQNPTAYKPYTPEYKRLGISPVISGSPQAAEKKPKAAPFAAYVLPKNQAGGQPMPTTKNVPYAEVGDIMKLGALPNSGNNMETAWSGVDTMIVDDLSEVSLEDNTLMIDNNDFVDVPSPRQSIVQEEAISVYDGSQLDVELNGYVLVVNGEIISTGNLEQVQEEVRALVFGEHNLTSEAVSVDDIIILKRVKIKMGVFIDG